MIKLSGLIVLLILFLSPSMVNAQTEASIKARVQNNTQNKMEIRTETRARVSAVRRERIRNYFSRMVTRIEAMILRLKTLGERIESKIGPHKNLTQARNLISEAEKMLDLAKSNLETTLESEEPQKEFKGVINSIKEIKNKLIEAHKLMIQTVREIKNEE